MSKRGDEPAYPCYQPDGPLMQDGYPSHGAGVIPGMTLREHYAGLAMQGLMSSDLVMRFSDDVVTANPDTTRGKWLAEQAIGFADALIAALNQEQGK